MRISDWSSDVCSSDLVAQAALAALGHQHAVAVARHVADDLVGGDVDDLGADRDDDGGVLAALAVALLAHAVLAALRAEPLLVAEVDQGVEVLRRLQPRSEEHTSELQSLMRNSYAVFCSK